MKSLITLAQRTTNLVAPRRWRLVAAALAASVLHTACADQTASQVSLAQLPVQARTTYERIHNGGPFPYDKDGSIFGNRERLLPAEKRGYYREYTVKTPRERSRGARRIVCGGWQATRPDACYYTADHYASFARIIP